jgi:hypothetical protein
MDVPINDPLILLILICWVLLSLLVYLVLWALPIQCHINLKYSEMCVCGILSKSFWVFTWQKEHARRIEHKSFETYPVYRLKPIMHLCADLEAARLTRLWTLPFPLSNIWYCRSGVQSSGMVLWIRRISHACGQAHYPTPPVKGCGP